MGSSSTDQAGRMLQGQTAVPKLECVTAGLRGEIDERLHQRAEAGRVPFNVNTGDELILRAPKWLWLRVLRRYLLFIALGNMLWELMQMPGFADWNEASWKWIAFIVVMGTLGVILIAATSLVLVLVIIGDESWPAQRSSYWRVAALATLAGVAYTTYSEWRHAVVLHHWRYSARMPLVPIFGVGLFPLLQWILIPPIAFLCAILTLSRVTSLSNYGEPR